MTPRIWHNLVFPRILAWHFDLTKRTRFLALFPLVFTVVAKEPNLPPPDTKERWSTLEKKGFHEWAEIKFLEWGGAADGGSLVFRFQTKDGIRFSVVIANRSYWTEKDIAEKRQVIYLIENGRYYLLNPHSEQERKLIEILTSAKSTDKESASIVKNLCDLIRTRKKNSNFPKNAECPG
jgi:hypothetical protein